MFGSTRQPWMNAYWSEGGEEEERISKNDWWLKVFTALSFSLLGGTYSTVGMCGLSGEMPLLLMGPPLPPLSYRLHTMVVHNALQNIDILEDFVILHIRDS